MFFFANGMQIEIFRVNIARFIRRQFTDIIERNGDAACQANVDFQ